MISPTIQFGLETEIGISSDAEGEVDVVSESIALVRSATEPGVWMCWDYDCEDPHVDMRGFRVHELRQDTDEANYYTQDAARELSFVEIKSDLVLGNGARFYNDAFMKRQPEALGALVEAATELREQGTYGFGALSAVGRAAVREAFGG